MFVVFCLKTTNLQFLIFATEFLNMSTKVTLFLELMKYRICSRNLRTFFFILAAEKSGCVKYADFFLCGDLDLGFIPVF